MSTYTQADLDLLTANIAKGVQSTKVGDEEVRFRSLDEMLRLKSMMETQLAASQPSRQHYPTFTRGT